MDNLHPVLRYVLDMCEEQLALAERYQRNVLSHPDWSQLPESDRPVVRQVLQAACRLATISEQLKVAIERLEEIDHLARVCSPDVLAEQLQDVLGDPDFLQRLGLPALRELEKWDSLAVL